MVTEIKRIVGKRMNISEALLSVSCFFHGAAKPEKKVLFLVTNGVRPVCMVKMIRDAVHNENLKRECEGQKKSATFSLPFRAPEVFFEEMVHGHFIYAEQVPSGVPIGKHKAAQFLADVVGFQRGVKKDGEVRVGALLDFFDQQLVPDKHMKELLEPLRRHASMLLFISDSHSDLTYMNIINGPEGVFLIDWERYGERPLWGVDFVHYFVRCFSIRSRDEFVRRLAASDVLLGVNSAYLEAIYALDMFFDIFQKAHPREYAILLDALHEKVFFRKR